MPEITSPLEEHIKDIQEITIAIDSWDDVFSDFDPSPLEKRILSEDFLQELKKRYRETQRGNFIITIYAPITLKDDASERIVSKRLKQYFRFRHLAILKEINLARRKGAFFVIFGVLFLSVLTLVTYYKMLSILTVELLGVVFLPLGWFGIWEGFSRIIESPPKLKHDLDLFGQLSKASYKFKYAGQVVSVTTKSASPEEKKEK